MAISRAQTRKKLTGRRKRKVSKVMKEFKNRKLRSGSKKGPRVTNKKQAIVIALSEEKKKKA